MRHSPKHKFILVNNWKCGCSSICKMFDGYCLPRHSCGGPLQIDWSSRLHRGADGRRGVRPDFQHAPAREIKKAFAEKGWDFDEYIKITSVRNPWARIVSLYFYHREGGKTIMDFRNYVKQVVPMWQAGIICRWNTREMIHDYDGTPLVDYVVRLENLKEDLSQIVEKHFPDFYINYNIRVNTTEHDHYSTYYNDESKSIIADLFHYDIERWGYKFENV